MATIGNHLQARGGIEIGHPGQVSIDRAVENIV